jgi:signal transduction histidine kinase
VEIRRFRVGLPRLDIALALALLAVKETFVFTGTLMSTGNRPLAVSVAAALTLPLAWRRRAPLAAAAIIAAAIVVDDLAAGWSGAVISFDCAIIAAYSAGANARQRHAAAALIMLLAANLVDAIGAPGNRAGSLALAVVVFSLVPWLVGQALRRERRRAAALQALAAELESQREQRARDAVTVERGRIARELHDIVGHAISLIAVQADAAAKLMRRDPQRALEPLQAIQTTSRGALGEMRQLVGLLRDNGAPPLLEPQPGVADLPRLVDDARRSGLAVTFDSSGEPRRLPATLDLAIYRIVQEGLTNVRKHARDARAFVSVRYELDRVDVEVRNSGTGDRATAARGGHGLLGIRERVTLLGGSLHGGPEPDGGFALRVRLPLPSADR